MLRYLLLPALLLTFAACAGEPDPAAPDTAAVELPDDPESIVGSAEDLLGTWIVTEQSGMQPQNLYSVTFTRTGDYILRDEFQAERRRTFTPAGDGIILLSPAEGAPAGAGAGATDEMTPGGATGPQVGDGTATAPPPSPADPAVQPDAQPPVEPAPTQRPGVQEGVAQHLRDAEQVAYSVSGDRLTLTIPGSTTETVLERRRDLLDARPELIPNVPVDPEPAQPPAQN